MWIMHHVTYKKSATTRALACLCRCNVNSTLRLASHTTWLTYHACQLVICYYIILYKAFYFLLFFGSYLKRARAACHYNSRLMTRFLQRSIHSLGSYHRHFIFRAVLLIVATATLYIWTYFMVAIAMARSCCCCTISVGSLRGWNWVPHIFIYFHSLAYHIFLADFFLAIFWCSLLLSMLLVARVNAYL